MSIMDSLRGACGTMQNLVQNV